MMWLFLGMLLIGSAAAQITSVGRCPNVETMEDFDVQKYLGKWYEAERYPDIFQLSGKCVTATYSANPNGTVDVLNSLVYSLTGRAATIKGYAMQKSPTKSKLSVVFPSVPGQREAPYWIVDTDYTSYAVMWSCYEFGIISAKFAWILTREQQPPVSVIDKAYAVLNKSNISTQFFKKTDQKNCP